MYLYRWLLDKLSIFDKTVPNKEHVWIRVQEFLDSESTWTRRYCIPILISCRLTTR